MTPAISIIHPSRSRPQQAEATASKWISSAKSHNNIEYILSLDNDEDSDAYEQAFGMLFSTAIQVVYHDNHSAIDAINNAAKLASGNLLIVVSDDFDCPFHWDDALLTALQDKEDFIVKTGDRCARVNYSQEWIITLPLMDRKYYERFGYIYYPEYQHMFCDTEMTHVADLLGRKITLDINFPHNHYSLLRTQPDEVSKKADKTWAQGEALYLKRISENFGLTEFGGSLQCDMGHKQWLLSKGVKI